MFFSLFVRKKLRCSKVNDKLITARPPILSSLATPLNILKRLNGRDGAARCGGVRSVAASSALRRTSARQPNEVCRRITIRNRTGVAHVKKMETRNGRKIHALTGRCLLFMVFATRTCSSGGGQPRVFQPAAAPRRTAVTFWHNYYLAEPLTHPRNT